MLGLFSGKPIFGGAYYWKDFCVSEWVALDNINSLIHQENSLKQLIVSVHGLYSGELIIGRIFVSEVWEGLFSGGLIFGGGGLLSEFYGSGTARKNGERDLSPQPSRLIVTPWYYSVRSPPPPPPPIRVQSAQALWQWLDAVRNSGVTDIFFTAEILRFKSTVSFFPTSATVSTGDSRT